MFEQRDPLAPYRVGGLLYTPATRRGVAEKIERGAYPCLSSMAFCLEDAIRDEALPQAEAALRSTLQEIASREILPERLPMLFARVRTPEHLRHVHALLGECARLLTGYILPKFDLSNAEAYAEAIRALNRDREDALCAMPILESRAVADPCTRAQTLRQLKGVIDGMGEYVLNVRVGGNDFCNLYGIRRPVDRSIYDVGAVRDILVDIASTFGLDYVVSGPVWEYFGSDPDGDWAKGLREELALDRLNGFIGKTAIHPCQLPLIRESLRVPLADFEDARSILGWSGGALGVARGSGARMNEFKVHRRWAERTLILAELYGIRGEALQKGGEA